MNFKLLAYASLLTPSILFANEGVGNNGEGGGETVRPPEITVKPTASPLSNEESKKVIDNADHDKLTGKKPPVPDYPGQKDGSDALIQFETPPPTDNSKACS